MQEQQADEPRRIAQALLLLRVPGHPYERRQLYRVALRQLLGLLAPGNGPDEPLVNCAASRTSGCGLSRISGPNIRR